MNITQAWLTVCSLFDVAMQFPFLERMPTNTHYVRYTAVMAHAGWYAFSVGLGTVPLLFEWKDGTEVKSSACASLPGSTARRLPSKKTVRRATGEAVGCVPPTALLFEQRVTYRKGRSPDHEVSGRA
jgi:hypothetical protein